MSDDPTDPIVTKIVDTDGVERWGAAGGPLEKDQPADVKAGDAGTEEVTDEATVPADGDSSNTGKRKR